MGEENKPDPTSTGARYYTSRLNWPAVAQTAIIAATIIVLALTGHANMVTVTVALLSGGAQAGASAFARSRGR